MATTEQIQKQNYSKIQNPYSNVATPKLGWLQRALDWIGLTNTAETNRYNHELAQNQWQSEFDLAQADISYNSPERQAELQRAAGLNPDLNGVQNFEADSSNPASSLSGLSAPSDSAIQALQPIANAIKGGIELFVGVSQGLVGLDEKLFDLKKKKQIFIEEEGKKMFEKMIRDSLDDDSLEVTINSPSNNPYLAHIKRNKYKRAISRYVYDNLNSWQAIAKERFKQGKEGALERNEYLEQTTKYGQTSSLNFDNSIVDVLADYNNLVLQAQKAAEKYKISDSLLGTAQNDYYRNSGLFQSDIYQGSLALINQNENTKQDIGLKKFQKEIQSMQLNFYRKLNNDPSGIGQFILFNILNQTGASMVGDLASGAMKAIPQTRYFHHLR